MTYSRIVQVCAVQVQQMSLNSQSLCRASLDALVVNECVYDVMNYVYPPFGSPYHGKEYAERDLESVVSSVSLHLV